MKNIKSFILRELISDYFTSEVTSGEFIHSIQIGKTIFGIEVMLNDVREAIQEFLDWDESPERFAVMLEDNIWKVTYDDWVEYQGKKYPVRHLTVEHCDLDGHVSYTIASESLINAMREAQGELAEDEGDFELGSVEDCLDLTIYHYVDDAVWHLSGKEIAEKHLDMPFVFVEE